MAYPLFQWPFPVAIPGNETGQVTPCQAEGVFFRALVELGTGSVAGIEPDQAELTAVSDLTGPSAAFWEAGTQCGEAAQGPEPGKDAVYLLRADADRRPERLGAALGLPASRTILMFDVDALFQEPARSLDRLIACKRAGARILLDNFDLDDPPARFMERLPADILRVSCARMPWHWDAAKRRHALEDVLGFAGNLLMDVAVADVRGQQQRQELRRLGVRYAQGDWRREARALRRTTAEPARG